MKQEIRWSGFAWMLVKLYMITWCSQGLFSAYPFILKTKHDTVSMLHSVEEDPSRSWFLWSRSPLGLRGLMKSDPSFIKIRGWGLVVKKKKWRRKREVEGGRNKPSLTTSHLRSAGRSKALDRWGVNGMRLNWSQHQMDSDCLTSWFNLAAVQPLKKNKTINRWNTNSHMAISHSEHIYQHLVHSWWWFLASIYSARSVNLSASGGSVKQMQEWNQEAHIVLFITKGSIYKGWKMSKSKTWESSMFRKIIKITCQHEEIKKLEREREGGGQEESGILIAEWSMPQ